jgi:hypothetical protein
VSRIVRAHPFLIGVRPAFEAIPYLGGRALLHAGPPLGGEPMSPPMRAAAAGAVVFEGWAPNLEDAEALLAAGGVALDSAHAHGALGPMAGIVSPSMPVFVVRNETFENVVHVTINEGLGRVLRFGANDADVLARLRWMRDVLAPALDGALRRGGPIDLRQIIAEALHRGDECHNRNKAATALFLKVIAPHLARAADGETAATCFEFVGGNDHFFLNLSMAHSKSATDPANGIPGSSIVTAMAANGRRFGVRVAGLPDWILGPAEVSGGRWFPGFTEADAAPLMGDSYVSEAVGIGAFAMAAAPAIAGFVGGRASEMARLTERMRGICAAEHPVFKIPSLDYAGVPVGIDVDRVVETGVAPVLNTGIAGKQPGVGQVGAGIQPAPMACFEAAARALSAAAAP